MLRQIAAATVVACCLTSAPATAQPAAPPHLSIVDGSVVVEHPSGREAAAPGVPLVAGDKVRTGRGRAEILFGTGAALHLDDDTLVVIDGDADVQLASGRVVMLGAPDAADVLQLDTAPASVRIAGGSNARVGFRDDLGTHTLVVGVVEGEADVASDRAGVTVTAGQQVEVPEGEAPGPASWFNTANREGFFEWSAAQLQSARDATSAEYLPTDLSLEADAFDQGGAWSYLAPYGQVWCPRVEPGWQPYTHGRWTYAGGVGWSFVGRERWAWATHHYGRWGMNDAGKWYWIPGTAWSPAWVRWGIAPGYVGWSPLGWDNHPIPRQTASSRPGDESGRGWTTMSSDDFRRGLPLTTSPADVPRRAPAGTAFAFQQASPRGPADGGRLIVAGPGNAARAVERPVAGASPETPTRRGDSRAADSRTTGTPAEYGPDGNRHHRPPGNPYPPVPGAGNAGAGDVPHPGDSPAYAPHYDDPWAYAPRYQTPGPVRPWPVRPPGPAQLPAPVKPSHTATPAPAPSTPPPPPPRSAQPPAHATPPAASVPSPKASSPRD